MRLYGWLLGGVMLGWFGGASAPAQTSIAGMGSDSAATPTTVAAALHAISAAAAVVFLGTVTAVRRTGEDPASAAAGVVEIDFTVEKAVRGCTDGGTYTLREWAGRWARTDERYRVGQRLFMLLHSPNAAGLSSPVRGGQGALPVRGGGATIGQDSAATGAGEAVVDLRWVGARLARPVVYGKQAPRRSAANAPSAITRESNGMGDAGPSAFAASLASASLVGAELAAANAGSSAPAQASVPAQEAAVAAVIAMTGAASPLGGSDDATR